jgi:hypothetical protein
MSSLWTDLLFLHGHLSDPELARRLADMPPAPPADPAAMDRPDRRPRTILWSLFARLSTRVRAT